MIPRCFRSAGGAAIVGVLAITLTTPVEPTLAEVVPDPDTDTAVAEALAAAGTGEVIVDDSSSTQCMVDDPVPVAYRNDRVVLRTDLSNDKAVNRVRSEMPGPGDNAKFMERIKLPQPTPPSIPDVVVVEVKAGDADQFDIVDLVRRVNEQPGVAASLDYALSPSGGPAGVWPSGPPKMTTNEPVQREVDGNEPGDGVDVLVFDTGLAPEAQANHPANVSQLRDPEDTEEVDIDGDANNMADVYFEGHTIPIASVLNTMASGADVHAVRITNQAEYITDISATRRMARVLRAADSMDQWPDLLVAAFGSPVCAAAQGGTEELAPLGLQAVSEAVDHHQEALLVASAGNRGSARPFYPAAFRSVVAVGALDATTDKDQNPWTSATRTAPLAEFSNRGSWVDAWAPGESLNTHHLINVRFELGEPLLKGWAYVSGTSYAAPIVASLIAEHMVTTGLGPIDAWEDLRDASNLPRCVAGGGGVALALPSYNAPADAPPETEGIGRELLC